MEIRAICGSGKPQPITPMPSAAAITALRSLTMTEILSVPVPTRPAMAFDRPTTDFAHTTVLFAKTGKSMPILKAQYRQQVYPIRYVHRPFPP
jgi:hypothetical protein